MNQPMSSVQLLNYLRRNLEVGSWIEWKDLAREATYRGMVEKLVSTWNPTSGSALREVQAYRPFATGIDQHVRYIVSLDSINGILSAPWMLPTTDVLDHPHIDQLHFEAALRGETLMDWPKVLPK